MTVPFDLQPVGEYPDVTVAQAHEALDSVFEELADLRAENLHLKAQLKAVSLGVWSGIGAGGPW